MREILFRGKRADNGQWVEGMLDGGNGQYLINCRTYSVYSNGYWVYKVDAKTVGQYTGLTDRNGKKIFEGDILKYKYTTGEETISVVCWVDEYGMFSNNIVKSDANNFSNQTHFNNGEVIGNIHDNPELLEGNK